MADKNWKDIAELIGIAAIVASMGAVAYELRQTQEALIASTYQARAFDAIAESITVSDSDYLLPILVATDHAENSDAVTALSAVDRGRLFHWLRARMIDWDNEYFQYQHGYLDNDFFETTTVRAIKDWAPRWRALGLRETRSGFTAFVDELLAESPATPQE